MPISDYSHHNEEASRIWWEEEGRHEEIENDQNDQDYTAEEAFAEDCAEASTEDLQRWLADEDYIARWPSAAKVIRWELRERGEDA